MDSESEQTSIREYCEGYAVQIEKHGGRLVIKAWNEGHYNSTEVDLLDVLKWAKEHSVGSEGTG